MERGKFLPASQVAKEVYRTFAPPLTTTPTNELSSILLSTLNTPDAGVFHDQLSSIDTYIDSQQEQVHAPSWLNVAHFKEELAKFNNTPFLQNILDSSQRYHLGKAHNLSTPADFDPVVEGYSWETIVQVAHDPIGVSIGNVHFFGWGVTAMGLAAVYGEKFSDIIKPQYADNAIVLAAQEIATSQPKQPQNAEEATRKLQTIFTGNAVDALTRHEAFYHEVDAGIRRCPMRGNPSKALFSVIGEIMTIPAYQQEFQKSITK